MNSAFCNNLTYLRKERGTSQKQAADELGISQSLLSHYEKGIRECGLDFLVKAADYYCVTCDYLLGRTAQRTAEPAPNNHSDIKKSVLDSANYQVVKNNVEFIYTLLSQIHNREITRYSTEILITGLYSLIRILYRINQKNDENMFLLSSESHQSYINSHREYNIAKLKDCVEKIAKSRKYVRKPELSYEIIMRDYSSTAGAVLNLIHTTEKSIKK